MQFKFISVVLLACSEFDYFLLLGTGADHHCID